MASAGIQPRDECFPPMDTIRVAAIGPTRSRQSADCCPRGTGVLSTQAQLGHIPLTNTGIYPIFTPYRKPMSPTPNPASTACRGHATALRKAARRVTQMYEDALAETGLRSTSGDPARVNNRVDAPPTMAELAEALVIERSALGHTLRAGARRVDRSAGRRRSTATVRRFPPPRAKPKFKEGASCLAGCARNGLRRSRSSGCQGPAPILLGLAYKTGSRNSRLRHHL